MAYLFGALVFLVAFIFAMRLLGAWMLRINEIIKYQEITINELRKLNGSYGYNNNNRNQQRLD
jgi:hypothetical protein